MITFTTSGFFHSIKAKKVFFPFIFILFLAINSLAQDGNLSMYTIGAKFLLDKTKIDPVIIEIVERTLPKAIKQDTEGAISSFASVIYEKKGIKELNPEFVKYTTNKITYLSKIFLKKDYFEITMSIADLILVTDNFLNKNIIPDKTYLNTNKMANSIVDTSSINKSVEVVEINHKTIIEKLKTINTEKKAIRCVAFTSFGGYAILYGTNGSYSNGIPKNASEKLKELNASKKEIKHIAFSPTGGYVILHGKNGWAANAVSQEIVDKLSELTQKGSTIETISFSPIGGYVIIYNKSGFSSSKVPVTLNDKLKEINGKGLEIKNVAFEEDGGYVINYGKNGWTSLQVPKTTSDKLNELNTNNNTLDFVSFITGGGHVIIYDNSGYSYRGAK